ncbi:MAG: RecX family transcriptional regulator [Acidobacteria bacterium]|nr:RecX family transcriptional regulator [Acidobacteriota bacterium]
MADAYSTGLRLLGRRELSTRQVRDRLARLGFAPPEVDGAVSRLTRAGALDDGRVARAFARTSAAVKGRGPDRVRRELALMGIPAELADVALTEVFGEVDEAALLRRALARKAPRGLGDARARRRVFAALVRQGFAPERVLAALRAHGVDDAIESD